MKYDRACVVSRRTQLQIQDVTALWWVTKRAWEFGNGPYSPAPTDEEAEAIRALYDKRWPAKVVAAIDAYNQMRAKR